MDAERYRAARDLPPESLTRWRDALTPHLPERPTILDVGAGTGGFAAAFTGWFGARVLAIEPDASRRALIPPAILALDGTAEHLPVPDGCADLAWFGSVLHHLDDLAAAAHETRRALRPGARVAFRNAFPGHSGTDIRVRWFPETAACIDAYPTVRQVEDAFAGAGFSRLDLRTIHHTAAPTLAEYATRLDRASDSKLRALTDDQYERGLARLRAADPHAPARSGTTLLLLA
ncbi:class I SAM-dependent methyltransferase [Frankia sp. AgB32]|uniref:class I SAM-dependent methyltransferase n=1 Tax=Frankia sp. AgB32 TaxID=631119 RepID=UPI00200C45C0|nr:class I SAM-dependent methyltransferase [Frankia sp. AgB32]MCK9893463.1 methyltransferase domain-containing protein [Frankia sp. AgB32]